LDAAEVTPRVVRLPHADSQEIGYAGAQTLLGLEPAPTGILCFSDAIAVGAVAAIQDSGRSVPADMSVVGFDDNPVARRSRPALTTVRQDSHAKGRAAAELLVAALDRDGAGSEAGPDGARGGKRARHLVLPTELVVRDSTASPPGG